MKSQVQRTVDVTHAASKVIEGLRKDVEFYKRALEEKGKWARRTESELVQAHRHNRVLTGLTLALLAIVIGFVISRT